MVNTCSSDLIKVKFQNIFIITYTKGWLDLELNRNLRLNLQPYINFELIFTIFGYNATNISFI